MRILITAGGTREYIDPVRFISNASSGKMGLCLARAALAAGHEVTLIAAPIGLRPPAGARVLSVTTASQMFRAVKRHFPQCDCLIMAAAVSDYAVARPSRTKVKRTGDRLMLELRPTPDIVAWAARHKAVRSRKTEAGRQKPQDGRQKTGDKRQKTGGRGQRSLRTRLVVGFALEDGDLRRRAQAKLLGKDLDMVVANTPAAIGAETSALHVKTPGGPWIELPAASKAVNARKIVRMIARIPASGSRSDAGTTPGHSPSRRPHPSTESSSSV